MPVCIVRWPGHFPAGKTLNGIVAHEDWLVTFATIAGDTDVKERLLKGTTINGPNYRAHLDGYSQLDHLPGKVMASARKEFFYLNDDRQIAALRYKDWKAVFLGNRGQGFGVWREPFTELRVPLPFNLRRDPFEKAQHNATT
jgi:arylsulfatase A-like enzyme